MQDSRSNLASRVVLGLGPRLVCISQALDYPGYILQKTYVYSGDLWVNRICFIVARFLHSVHGFERTVVSVDEGAMPETLVIRLDIKGNTLDESPQSRVSDIHLTVRCQDVTTGEWLIYQIIMRASLWYYVASLSPGNQYMKILSMCACVCVCVWVTEVGGTRILMPTNFTPTYWPWSRPSRKGHGAFFQIRWSQCKILGLDPVLTLFTRDALHKTVNVTVYSELCCTHIGTVQWAGKSSRGLLHKCWPASDSHRLSKEGCRW